MVYQVFAQELNYHKTDYRAHNRLLAWHFPKQFFKEKDLVYDSIKSRDQGDNNGNKIWENIVEIAGELR